jgi:hypothetical protein
MNGFMLSSLERGSGPHDYYVGGAMLDHAHTGDKVSQQGVRCAVAIPVLFATHFMQRSIGGQKERERRAHHFTSRSTDGALRARAT